MISAELPQSRPRRFFGTGLVDCANRSAFASNGAGSSPTRRISATRVQRAGLAEGHPREQATASATPPTLAERAGLGGVTGSRRARRG